MIESNQGDSRVKSRLDELGLKYKIDEDGDFRVLFSFEDGRKHEGFILSETSRFEGLEIREVISVGHVSDGPLDADLANAFLIFNSNVKFGAWQIRSNDGERCVVVFSALVAADTDSKSLDVVLRAVIVTAENVKRKLNAQGCLE